MLNKKTIFCLHKYNCEKIKNLCFNGGFYQKFTCVKCEKIKNYYW